MITMLLVIDVGFVQDSPLKASIKLAIIDFILINAVCPKLH